MKILKFKLISLSLIQIILINENTSFDFKIKILRAFKLLPPQFANFAELIKNNFNGFLENNKNKNFCLVHLRYLQDTIGVIPKIIIFF